MIYFDSNLRNVDSLVSAAIEVDLIEPVRTAAMDATKRRRHEGGFSVQEGVSAALVSEFRMHCASGNRTLYGLTIFSESTKEYTDGMSSELEAESREYNSYTKLAK